MISLVIVAVNVLLLMCVWHFMICPTLLDHYRDKLFDLRDEMRRFFIDRDISLDDDVYRSTRDLLNGYIRYMEDLTFLRFVAMQMFFKLYPESAKIVQIAHEQRFVGCHKEIKEKVAEVRHSAIFIILSYMFYSSIWLTVLAVFVTTVMAVRKAVFAMIGAYKQRNMLTTPKFYKIVPALLTALAVLTTMVPAKLIPSSWREQNIIEERVISDMDGV